MADKPVSMIRCDSYNRSQVMEAMEQSLDQLGGMGKFVSPGQRVLLKPNLLQAAKPEKCVTPHPEVVYAVAKLLKEHGCKVTIADSPGAGTTYTEGTLRKVYATCGLDKVAEELDVELNYKTGYRDVPAPQSKTVKRFLIIDPAMDADAIVVVSKAKTHVLTGMTGAAKNIFGVIPGMEKPGFHLRMKSVDEFSNMIIDLNQLMGPKLQVMDAVMGMEGNGPHTGEPRKLGLVLASADYTALDVVVARLMAFSPNDIGTIRVAVARGLLSEDLNEVKVVGGRVEDFVVKDFKKPTTLDRENGYASSPILRAFSKLARAYALRPEILRDRCIGCGKCERVCPVKTIRMMKGKARIKHSKCIRCYCCHEMCGENAIELDRSLGGKVLARMVERGRPMTDRL